MRKSGALSLAFSAERNCALGSGAGPRQEAVAWTPNYPSLKTAKKGLTPGRSTGTDDHRLRGNPYRAALQPTIRVPDIAWIGRVALSVQLFDVGSKAYGNVHRVARRGWFP